MSDETEMWKQVTEPDFGPDYIVSNKGRMAKILRGRIEPKTGYVTFIVSKRRVYYRSYRVHQLVARAFNGPQPEGTVVNHKDCDKTNNEPENLEYVTQAENVRHAIRMRHRIIRKYSHNGQFKPLLTVDQVGEIKAMLNDGCPIHIIAREYGVSSQAIKYIKTGRNWNRVPAKP